MGDEASRPSGHRTAGARRTGGHRDPGARRDPLGARAPGRRIPPRSGRGSPRGDAGQPGSGTTPRAAHYAPADFNVNLGASVRMVMDVGAWDNSVFVNTPGQSGDPASPHYADLFPLWAGGAYAPLLYSRAAVDKQAERRISLTPGS